MAQIVNLRTRRKQAARAAAREAATRRALPPGVTRAQRDLAEARRAREEAALDGHRREAGDPDQSTGREPEA